MLASRKIETLRSGVTGLGSKLVSGRAGVPPTRTGQLPPPCHPLKPLLTPSSSPWGFILPLQPGPQRRSLHHTHFLRIRGSEINTMLPVSRQTRSPNPPVPGATVTAHTGAQSPSETTKDTSQGEVSSCLNPLDFGRCSASYFKGKFVPVLPFLPSPVCLVCVWAPDDSDTSQTLLYVSNAVQRPGRGQGL